MSAEGNKSAGQERKSVQDAERRDRRGGRNPYRKRKNNRRPRSFTGPAYGALDLGTNNCRLLVARPTKYGFKVIDAFSRIVRLGEGLTQSRCLSDAAMRRTIEALKVCTDKLARRKVTRSRLIATEACRKAYNGPAFIERVYEETGLRVEVIDRETEARLAVAGSAALIEPDCNRALIFDIGGGSSELMWLKRQDNELKIEHWTSIPIGVVTLSERFDGRNITQDGFLSMTAEVAPHLKAFEDSIDDADRLASTCGHMLGTSGTVTTLAGVARGLTRYDRKKVDGCWLSDDNIEEVTARLLGLTYEERSAVPCIGSERADLVLAGCAILQAILQKWPCSRVRVADRGLREGILTSLMEHDGHGQKTSKLAHRVES